MPIRDAARRRFRGSCEPCYYFSLLVLVLCYILSPVGASDSDRLLLTKRKSENLKRYEAVVIQKNRRRLGCGEKGEYWKKTSVVGTGYCASCTTGRYSAGKGKDHGLESCKFCSSGQYNPSNMQTSCTSCSPGTFQNEIGQSNCNDCAAGLFQTEAGQSSCFAPECTQINGNEPNNAVCQCGSTTCSSETGFYCTQSTTAFGASTCALGHFVLKLTVLLPIPLPVPVALHYVPLTPASIVLNLIVRVLLGHHVLKLTVLLLIPLPVSVALHYVPLRNLYAINLVVLVLNQYHCAVK